MNAPTVSRRARAVHALATLALAAAMPACQGEAAARDRSGAPLVVGFVAPAPTAPAVASALRGAELGAEEAARTGALLGRAFEMRQAVAEGPAESVRAARRLLDAGVTAIVGGFDDSTCVALGELARARGALFVNVGCRADALRGREATHTYHVEASDSMYLRALGASREHGGAAPVLWHGALERYGAAQLNQRFTRRFGRPADAPAWASWMAMKVLWQAALEARTADPDRLATFLLAPEAEFDGHKGEPLRFDAASHQLRQPLFPPTPGEPDAGRDAPPGAPLGVAPLLERNALRAAVDAATPLLVVTNEGSREVTILDANAGTTLATIPLAERPRGVWVGAGGEQAWVALSDESPTSEGRGDAVAVIDLREGKIVARHAAGSDPEQFAVSHDGRTLYAANEDAGTATVSDVPSGKVLATLIVGIEPEGVAVSPDGRWVYVTGETSNTVSVIDTRRREVAASFLVGERPRAAAFAPDGSLAFVTNEIGGTVSLVDVARHAVVATITLAGGRAHPVGVVVSPEGARAYVANGRANSVSVIDVRSRREVGVIAVGRRPWGIALSRDGSRLYVANGGSGDVSVIDTRTERVVSTIPVGERPWGVAATR